MVRQGQRSRYAIVDQLNNEWGWLEGQPHPQVIRWRDADHAFADCTNPADVLQAIGTHPDIILGRLLAWAGNGDTLAARVVLQAMLGKMVKMARGGQPVAVDQLVAALWCTICTYPLAERPTKIAANLALDTWKIVSREKQWARRTEVVLIEPGERYDDLCARTAERTSVDHGAAVANLSATHVLRMAHNLGLLDTATHGLLTNVYAHGMSGRHVAAQHELSVDTVRFRCSRGVRRLARHALALAEAA